MPSLGQQVYFHAPLWQVLGVLGVTALLLAWLARRAFERERVGPAPAEAGGFRQEAAPGGPAGDAWIALGPSVRVHASRPIAVVHRGGETWSESQLTPVEDTLLRRLLAARGEVKSAEELFAAAWPEDPVDPVGLRPEQNDRLRRLVFQLRQRLEPDPSQPRHLLTARGMGYSLYADEGPHAGRVVAE